MRNTVGISHRLKRAWLDDVLDRLVQTRDEKELRAFVDQRLRDELPGKEARAKAAGILLRIWSGVEEKHVALRDRAVALLPRISGQERIWLHWGMTALAYPFYRDLAEVIGRMLTLQDDFTTAQVQARMKTAWGDRVTSKEAAQKLITGMVDWEVLRATKTKGHFLLARKMTTTVSDLQLWLLEAMLSASASDEIEAQQLLRLPELFPFAFTVGVGDLRKHEGFNIHRQGLDMDMVAVRHVKVEPPPKPPARQKKRKATDAAQLGIFAKQEEDVVPSTAQSVKVRLGVDDLHDGDLEEAPVDDESTSQPVFQEIPDEITEDWTHGVLIGGMATETSEIVVAEAYWWAAEQLIEPALRSREAFLYSHPILFLIRHALELYLKAIVNPPNLSHELGPLVAELDRVLESRFRQKLPPEIRTDLETLARIDPRGTSFRYTAVKGKQGVYFTTLEGEYWVPLGTLRRRMAVIFECLKKAERLLR